MNKKGAVGLTMNMIVILIISMVILTGGILFIKNLVTGAEDIKAQLDQKTEDEIRHLITDQGKKVALPLNTVTVLRGENHVFGLGILNIDSEQYTDTFKIEVGISKLVDSNEQFVTLDSGTIGVINSWVLYNDHDILIKENEYHSEPLLVSVPKDAVKGTYIFNVRVKYSIESQYDNVKKFYVTVP